jgi:SulP family sulfate permease
MLTRIFPFLVWFKGYNQAAFRIDLVSGVTVALVLIPQSMAYAQLAGLPPHYGLYASFLPPMIAALFGSSRQLATGPVAVVSLMTSASLEPLATAGSEGYIGYAILLALMVGGFQLALGVLRLGLVVNFLSHPVVNGFTNAAAIIIATSQLSKLFGVSVDNAEHHYETVIKVVQAAVHYTHWPTLMMAALAFAIMYLLRWFQPRLPNVLIAVAVTTALSAATHFQNDQATTLEAIRSQEVQHRVAELNRVTAEIQEVAAQRTAAMEQISAAEKTGETLSILEAEHVARVLSARLDELKESAGELKSELRWALFTRIDTGDGSHEFYPQDTAHADGSGAGGTWRLKVGSSALDPERLIMIGGGSVVGTIPRGLPSLAAPKLDLGIMIHLLPFATIISLLGFMEAISIAKAMAAKTGQRLDPNQELIGQGLANMCGALARSYPTSGSFSRSAVNLQAGAVTGLSSVITSLAVVITLMFLTPLLYHLPQSVLAAVIMMAVIGLVNVSGFVHAWRAQWYDGAISIASFVGTLAFAPHLDKGIMIGVLLSLGVFLYKSMRPTVATLSRHHDESFRAAVLHNLQECKYIDMVRFDAPLFFANATYLEDQINDRLAAKRNLRHIIIVSNGINDIDASGEETLSLVIDRVRSAGIEISFCGMTEAVMAVLERTHLIEKIGRDRVFPTMEKAICAVHEHAHQQGDEDACPLTTNCRAL